MSENCVFGPSGQFLDLSRTLLRHFSDILSTFPFSGLSNDLPVTTEGSVFFLYVFPFSKDFRGSVGINNPCFFKGFSLPFCPSKQGKEGQGCFRLCCVFGCAISWQNVRDHQNRHGCLLALSFVAEAKGGQGAFQNRQNCQNRQNRHEGYPP